MVALRVLLSVVAVTMEAYSEEIGGCFRRRPEVVRRDLRGLAFCCQQLRWMGTHFHSTFPLCTCKRPHAHTHTYIHITYIYTITYYIYIYIHICILYMYMCTYVYTCILYQCDNIKSK